jgi:putative tricarboxylic transport membrane protein
MDHVITSLLYLLTPAGMGWCVLGTTLGLIVGAIPGLGGGMMMALILPLTFSMANLDGQTFLLGIYVGGVGGSLVSAVLIGVPGSPAAVMTAVDGYAMTKKGRAGEALSLGIMASLFGGLVSWVILLSLSIPLAKIAIGFQSFDYFLFVVMGLILIGAAGSSSMIKSLIAGFFGLFAVTVGFDNVSAVTRFTFNVPALASGFDLLPVLIGAFAIQRIIIEAGQGELNAKTPTATIREITSNLYLGFKHWAVLLRSSLLGTWIGILPGLGANIGAIVCYSVAKKTSHNKANYGKGEPEAIAAAESGNNATVGGALVPMIAIGIPGSSQDAILMAALIMHHVEPGPLLITQNPEVFYGLISAYLFANIIMFVALVLAIRLLTKVVSTPMYLMAPVILTICVVGVISANNRIDDVWVMLGFGVVGYLMSLGRYPLAPFVIGFVLGPLAEERLRSSLMSSGGEFLPLLLRPMSLALMSICLSIILFPLIRSAIRTALSD